MNLRSLTARQRQSNEQTSASPAEPRLRALRNKYRRLAGEQRFLRKAAERKIVEIEKAANERIAALEAEIRELAAVNVFSRRQLRRTWHALQGVAATLLLGGGIYFGAGAGSERQSPVDKPRIDGVSAVKQTFVAQPPQSRQSAAAEFSQSRRGAAAPTRRDDPSRDPSVSSAPLRRFDCPECDRMAKTESHVLASVKMSNGSTGCSATVVGDPVRFREHKKVLVVSAAHCVTGNIGKSATFHNPDGQTSFPATLLAFNREFDCSIFVADSDKPLGAVLMADPGDWDQRAKFSSCNYPAQSGGPNYKFCAYAGPSSRAGANSGHLFTIDRLSQEHDGFFSSGGSGGGLFVQPAGSSDWFYFGATTHGGNGTEIATTKHADLYQFIAEHYPPADDRDCGPWCRRPPRRPPIDPNTPPDDGHKPPWYNPNLPIEPGDKPTAPPEKKPPEAPTPNPDITVLQDRVKSLEAKLELTIKQVTDIRISSPVVGPAGPAGQDGQDGANGKDGTTPEVDYARLELKAETVARAAVEALFASGALTGKNGPPGEPGKSPAIDVEEIVKKVKDSLPPIYLVFDGDDPDGTKSVHLGERVAIPPVRMEIRKDGRSYPNSKPLGKVLSLEFAPL